MDQNLRGARDLVAPLTRSNLQRATSVGHVVSPFDRFQTADDDTSGGSAEEQVITDREYFRAGSELYDTKGPYRPRVALARTSAPVGTTMGQAVQPENAAWTAKALRGTRSQLLPRDVSVRSFRGATPESALDTLPEVEPGDEASSSVFFQSQVKDLRGRISSLRDRAREDSIRRQSQQRQTNPLTDAQVWHTDGKSLADRPKRLESEVEEPDFPSEPPAQRLTFDPRLDYAGTARDQVLMEASAGELYTHDHNVSGLTEEEQAVRLTNVGSTARSQHESEAESIYEDTIGDPSLLQRHEDREDAFDYQNFFLHSAMGRLGRRPSTSSTDSADTARGPAAEAGRPPPTPETPETLREIERNLHLGDRDRSMSEDSVSTLASFATAREGASSRNRSRSPQKRVGSDGADSGMGLFKNANSLASRLKAASIAGQPPLPPASLAVGALLDPASTPLGLKDKALVFIVVESLKKVCANLQAGEDSEYDHEELRRRLDEARRALHGLPPGRI